MGEPSPLRLSIDSVTSCAHPIEQFALVMSDGSQIGIGGDEGRGWLLLRWSMSISESGIATLCRAAMGVAAGWVPVATLCRAAVGVAGRGVLVATLSCATGARARAGSAGSCLWRAVDRVVRTVAVGACTGIEYAGAEGGGNRGRLYTGLLSGLSSGGSRI